MYSYLDLSNIVHRKMQVGTKEYLICPKNYGNVHQILKARDLAEDL